MVQGPGASFSALLAAELRPRLEKLNPGQVLAVRIESGERPGIDAIEIDGKSVAVAFCPSNIAIRKVLAERGAEAGGDRALVILTDRDAMDLEEDLLARLYGRKLQRLEPWHAVAQLFKASVDGIDSRLRKKDWMASVLLEEAPADGYAAAAGGTLTVERAYQEVLRSRFLLAESRPDLVALLRWGRNEEARRILAEAPPDQREDIMGWLVDSAGAMAGPVLGLLLGERGDEAVAFGLVMEVVGGESTQETLARRDARSKLEVKLDDVSASPEGLRDWARAARLVFDESDDERRRRDLEQAEAVILELKAGALAEASSLLLSGLVARRRELARTIERLVKKPEPSRLSELEAAISALEAHALHQAEGQVNESSRMVKRLGRWLVTRSALAQADYLGEIAKTELAEAGFVDLAAERLAVGHESEALVESYKLLLTAVAKGRNETALVFGRKLAEATALGRLQEGLIGVEEVLDRVVKPVAESSSVLLLVLDGAGTSQLAAIGRELEGLDLSVCEFEGKELPAVLAALPSLTEVSRSCLFSGRLVAGKQAGEKAAFAAHPGLVAVSKNGKPPKLFHKKELEDEGSKHIAAAVRKAIEDSSQRVVGLVINAVDDHLSKGDQVPVAWGIDQILHLRAVLSLARDAGRVVILTSDHGHLLDRDLEKLDRIGENARWRQALGNDPMDGEVLVSGPRVLAPGNRAILLASSRMRYGGRPQNGYHGGASPQEVVIPLAILAPSSKIPAGLVEVGFRLPEFWLVDDEAPASVSVSETKVVTKKVEVPDGFLPGLEEVSETVEVGISADAGWISLLLTSALYKEQEKRWKRMAPPIDRVRLALEALAGRGGKLTSDALARAVAMPVPRLRGFTAAMQKVLNLDGVVVFSFDLASDSFVLDERLAREQFLE